MYIYSCMRIYVCGCARVCIYACFVCIYICIFYFGHVIPTTQFHVINICIGDVLWSLFLFWDVHCFRRLSVGFTPAERFLKLLRRGMLVFFNGLGLLRLFFWCCAVV